VSLSQPRLEHTASARSGLDTLGRLLDNEEAASVLASLLPQSSVRVAGTRLVRLKPGKRAVLLWRATVDGKPRTYYAKLFATPRATRVNANHRAVWEALRSSRTPPPFQPHGLPKVVVPEPAGHTPDGSLFVMRAVGGEPVAPGLARGDEALARRIAGALAVVHGSGAALERRHTAHDELEVLDNVVGALGRRRPDLARPAVDIADAVRRRLAGREWRACTLHRDFYADQVLELAGALPAASVDLDHAEARDSLAAVGIIDFDDAKCGEPALDVANFAAHLVLDALRSDEPAAWCDPGGPIQRDARCRYRGGHASPPAPGGHRLARAAFLDEYFRLDPGLDPAAVAALEAGTLLRLAWIHGERDGHGLETRLVDAAAVALTAGALTAGTLAAGTVAAERRRARVDQACTS
jgi:aminoglycoside phosphotransferase (APT) family kinase protein